MGWLRRLFFRERLEADLDKELRFHFESQVADKVRSGIPESEARRLTRIEFGGIEQIKEDCRERRGTLWLESLLQDVRYSLRQLWKSPGFTLTAVLTLALGIGGTTAIFTLIHQVMLRSLPVARPDQLWHVGDSDHCCFSNGYTQGHGRLQAENHWIFFSWEAYKYLRAHTPAFENLAAFQPGHTMPTWPCGHPVPRLLSRCEMASTSPAISSRRSAFLPGGDGSSPMPTTWKERRQ
jgi:hypothetical protein